MKILKGYLPEIVIFPFLGIVYFLTRLVTIMSLPIFTDEAIYTRWAQIARFDSSWRFISLTDGKQPSFIWLDMIVMRFVDDPLLAGRFVSVGAGFMTMVGIYFLTYEVFKNIGGLKARCIGLISSAIVVILPFTLVYDRLAIYDSLVAAFFVWALYFQVRLARVLRFDHAMLLGFVYGGAVLTKSIGFLSIYLSPFLILLLPFAKKGRRNRFLKLLAYLGVATVIAYGMYSILRLSPFFHIIEEKNSIFVYSVNEWLKFQPMDMVGNFIGNFRGLFDWLYRYFTIPYLVLALVSFIVYRKVSKEKLLLFIFFLAPFLALSVFGKTLYPRYVLFMVMPLVPLVALAIYSIFERYKKPLARVLVAFIVVAMPFYMNYFILFDFARAPIPRLDLEQYINGWPAGGGVVESVNFFSKQAQNGPIFIGTQGTFGLMPSSYEIYFQGNRNITTKGYWPVDSQKLPDELVEMAKTMPVYFVFYQPCPDCEAPGIAPSALGLQEVSRYKKGVGETFLTIYQVK